MSRSGISLLLTPPADDGPAPTLDDLCGEWSHCSPCESSFAGSPRLCPRCGRDTLITTWGAAQEARFWSGERYEDGCADVDGAPPLRWRSQ